MKEVLAVIRMNQIGRTKQALVDAGFPGFNAVKVTGRGRQAIEAEAVEALNQNPEYATEVLPLLGRIPRLIPKRLLSIIVSDEQVEQVVTTLVRTNQTRNPGDGKIFVLPVTETVRVRTGETGRVALDEMTG